MDVTAKLSFEEFHCIYNINPSVKNLTKAAQEIVFNKILVAQEQNVENKEWVQWLTEARERSSADIYNQHEEVIDGLGGPLLDLLYDNHPELLTQLGIPMGEDAHNYDEARTDISYIIEHHATLVKNKAYLDDVAQYINDELGKPYTQLKNGEWLVFDTSK